MTEAYRALLLDLSGVLYEGDHTISGAVAAVEAARARGLVLRFVTNTATRASDDIIRQLARMDIQVAKGELFTAPAAARAYIREQGLRPFCLVHEAIRSEFAQLNQDDPDCVLLGDAREGLHYQSLNEAFRLCKQGAPLIGIGMNKYFKDEQGLSLDAGAFIRAIEWAADTKAIIMGKPSRKFYAQVVASTSFPASACLMVGDDVAADVVAAVDAGLQACLVRTGKYQPGDEQQLPAAGSVVDSVADLFFSANACLV